MRSRFLTFKGGIKLPGKKQLTNNIPIENIKPSKLVYIPLKQHVGSACQSIVEVGDQVKLGQVIGEQRGFVGAPVHASVSGKVKSIMSYPTPQGGKEMTVVIENDGMDTLHESIKPRDVHSLTNEEIMEAIRDAGIVGLGGATFPTHAKLSPPNNKKIDTIILNGIECEPYITSDDRIMIEKAQEVVEGLKIIMKLLDVKLGYIALVKGKEEAIQALEKAIDGDPMLRVKTIRGKYPLGCEKKTNRSCNWSEGSLRWFAHGYWYYR